MGYEENQVSVVYKKTYLTGKDTQSAEERTENRKQWSKEMEAEAAGTAILIVTEGDFSQKEKG